jgi:hypothetical protein
MPSVHLYFCLSFFFGFGVVMSEKKNNPVVISEARNAIQPSEGSFIRLGIANKVQPRKLSPRVAELMRDRDGLLPVWVRAPVRGPEHYCGFSRAKLYDLAANRKIRSVSIREPGQVKGTRLFNLASILSFIDECELAAGSQEASVEFLNKDFDALIQNKN